MLINNKTKRITTIEGVRFNNGINDVTAADWAKAEKVVKLSPFLLENLVVIKSAVLDEKGKETKDKEPVEFEKLSNKQAAEVVKNTLDIGVLETWLENETRESVRKAIYAQIETLKVSK